MKILYSHRTKSADGQYVHIRALTEALSVRGHQVIMAGPDDFDSAKSLDARAGEGGVRKLLPKPVYEIAEFAYSAPAYMRLLDAAKKSTPDVLYERYNLFYHSGVRLARARRLPFLLEVNAPLAEERADHGGLAFPALARWSEREIWRAADAVLPVTGVLAEKIAAAGVLLEKIHVIQNGVDEAFLADVAAAPVREKYGLENKIVLGFTGFVRDWHRVDYAVRYMADASRGDLHLLIVGDGAARDRLERLATDFGVRDRVTITGVVQREEVPAHVAAFDIAMQPAAVSYASPLKLFEYMALARAIIAPSQENIREVLADGDNALLFPPDDEAAFCGALDALVPDAALRARLGAAARDAIAKGGYTWDQNAARVESIAAGLLEKKQ